MINYVYQLVSPRVFTIEYTDISFDDQVVVKPTYMAVCHADQRYYQGLRDQKVLQNKLPMALIHECCGEVVYDPTGTYQVGEQVVMVPNQPGQDDEVIYENYQRGSSFLSSGIDGFMREYVEMKPERMVSAAGVDASLAAITEFISVAVHSISRFDKIAHERREKIGIWGDGSLAYVVACVLKQLYPESTIYVYGMSSGKLAYFSFVDKTFMADDIPEDLTLDHAFECCGGSGSAYAIDDIIRYINPQGTVMLMGVSENKVGINTRDVLEKGLTMVGSSRSGVADFQKAVELMKNPEMALRLGMIVYEDRPVKTVDDIHRVFHTDLTNSFKTVFKWKL